MTIKVWRKDCNGVPLHVYHVTEVIYGNTYLNLAFKNEPVIVLKREDLDCITVTQE